MAPDKNDIAVVTASLERCAEADIDITDMVYERFFAQDQKAHQLMESADQYMRGRMLEQVLMMVMSEEDAEDAGYLRWELENHLLAYSVELDMYERFLVAVADSVEAALGDDWESPFAEAWSRRIERFLQQINRESAAVS